MSSETLTKTGPGGPVEPPRSRGPFADPATLRTALVVTVAVVPAGIGLAAFYGAGITLGALFLAGGWASLVAAGYLLYRAATELDLAPRDPNAAPEGEISDRERLDLEREKRLLLKAIKEIEFDHAMGKIDDADAAEVTRRYRTRAIEILKLLDGHKPKDYSTTVEKELSKRLAKAGVGGGPAALPAETKPSAAKLLAPEVSIEPVDTSCPACGVRNDLDAVFCKKCGGKLGGGGADAPV